MEREVTLMAAQQRTWRGERQTEQCRCGDAVGVGVGVVRGAGDVVSSELAWVGVGGVVSAPLATDRAWTSPLLLQWATAMVRRWSGP